MSLIQSVEGLTSTKDWHLPKQMGILPAGLIYTLTTLAQLFPSSFLWVWDAAVTLLWVNRLWLQTAASALLWVSRLPAYPAEFGRGKFLKSLHVYWLCFPGEFWLMQSPTHPAIWALKHLAFFGLITWVHISSSLWKFFPLVSFLFLHLLMSQCEENFSL